MLNNNDTMIQSDNLADCRACSCTVDCDESADYVIPTVNCELFFCSQACAADYREVHGLDENYKPIEDLY